MSRVRLAVAPVLALVLGATTYAQEKQSFVLKLEKDKPFFQRMKTDVQQVIKVQGQDLTQKQESTFFFKWLPVRQEGDKWVLKQTVEGLVMKIDISGNPIEYDSSKKDAAGGAGNPGLMDFFRSLEGSEFTVTLGKDFKVEKVEGKDDFVKKLGAGNTQMDTLLRKIMTDDALKQMADPTFGLIPDQPKAVNETWERKQTLSLGPIGSYEVTYKFTYKGKDTKQKDLDRVEVAPSLVYKPPTENTEGLLFRIKSGTLTSEQPDKDQPDSVILYNPKTGRVEQATISLKLKGDLVVTIGASDTKVELSQKQTTTIDTRDATFLETPKK